MTVTRSSEPGAVLAANRAKDSSDNRAANALFTAYGELPPGSEGQALIVNSGNPLGYSWATVGTPPPLVNDLPASPTHGDQIFLQPLSVPGGDCIWHMYYNGPSNEWVYLGGAPMFDTVATSESTTSNTYTDLTTVGPSVTIPDIGTSGIWDVHHGAGMFVNAGLNPARMSYAIGATAASDNEQTLHGGSGTDQIDSPSRANRKTLNANVQLLAKYRCDGTNTATFLFRWMRVQPVVILP